MASVRGFFTVPPKAKAAHVVLLVLSQAASPSTLSPGSGLSQPELACPECHSLSQKAGAGSRGWEA